MNLDNGCSASGARKSLSVDDARRIILDALSPVSGWERVAIRSALGRILSEDVIAPCNVPAHDNSAMDGYAVRAEDLSADTESTLQVVGTAFAGRGFSGIVGKGQAVRIMTGGVMPMGADTIVVQEVARPEGDQVIVPGGVRRGQNVRLASQLTGSQIDIMTEAESSEKRQKEFVERSEMFQQELDVDETLAQLLVAEGFSELEEVAYVALEEIAGIEGLDDELAEELQSRAAEALERKEEASRNERRELGVEDALAELPHLTEAMLVTLGKAGIKTLDDLADLATDELIQKKRVDPRRKAGSAEPKGGVLAEYNLSEEQGNEIIMAARAHWFEEEGDADAVTPA